MALVDDFKGALGSWASGVSVVTTRHEHKVYGLTVSSFSSLSVDPLLVVVCLANSNEIAQMVQDAGHFAVNILSTEQEAVSRVFAVAGRHASDTLGDDIVTHELVTGSPLLDGAIAHLDCELTAAIPGGDHTIAIGAVVGASFRDDLTPLLYFRRRYYSLTGS